MIPKYMDINAKEIYSLLTSHNEMRLLECKVCIKKFTSLEITGVIKSP